LSINLLAPCSSLGYGVVGLNLIVEMERAGLSPAWWPIGGVEAPPHCHDVLRAASARTTHYDRNAPSLRLYHQFALAEHVGKGPHVGFPIFELNKFTPTELHHLRSQDALIVPSNWAKDVIVDNGFSGESIHVAPLGVDISLFDASKYTREGTPHRDATVFLNVGKWETRKGHDVILTAFERAFTKSDNVRLIMSCHNPCFPTKEKYETYNRQWVTYYKDSALGEKIEIFGGRFNSQEGVVNLMARADCGVFPSRAEGWNLPLLEMLALGKHVIATDYSAHTEFLTQKNAYLIKVDKLTGAYDGQWFHGQGEWADLGEAQLEQMVAYMRMFHAAKQEGLLRRNEAGIETARRFSWANTVHHIAEALGLKRD
jgi:glycosyltransferase involved in cell wall biosynthesis